MTMHAILNATDHKTLRILPQRNDDLGDAVMCCVTFPAEFRNVQNHYPILFQLSPERDAFSMLALFGFENGEICFAGRSAGARAICRSRSIFSHS